MSKDNGHRSSDQHPQASDLKLAEVFAEYVDRVNAGEKIEYEEVLASHPDLASDLINKLQILQEVDFEADHNEPLGTLGDYTLRRQIGRGGMGVVYEAWQNSVERSVALKVLPAGIAADNKAFVRFMREAKTAAQLNHQNVVSVYAMGVDDNTPYYAMEYVEGNTLAQVLSKLKESDPETETPFGPKDQVDYFAKLARTFADVADGLQHAHSKGVVHRDIKPSNLILDTEGHLRVLDFGLAHLEGQDTLTISGDVVGTPLYMSPEQARRRKVTVDHRTDIYSLGATLYEAICGRPPFRGKDHADTLSQVIECDPVELKRINPRVPKDLQTIVLKCLCKDPKDRYGTAEALAQDLRRFVRGDTVEARPLSRWVSTVRRIRRNRVRFVSGVVVLSLVTSIAGLLHDRRLSESRETAAEYDRQVVEGMLQLLRTRGVSSSDVGRGVILDPRYVFHREDFRILADEEGAGGFEKAVHLLGSARDLLPDRPEAHYYLARAYLVQGRHAVAFESARRSFQCDPSFAPAEALLEELESSDEREASPVREVASGERSGDRWATLWLAARRALRNRLWREAASSYTCLLDLDEQYLGSNLDLLLGRGIAHLDAGDFPQAITDFLRASEFAPEFPEPRLLLGQAWYRNGNPEETERVYREVYRSTKSRDDVAAWISVSYHALGDLPKVLDWTQRIPQESIRERLKALYYFHSHRAAEAITSAERALDLVPDDSVALFTLAGALQIAWSGRFGPARTKSFGRLRKLARRAAAVDSENPFPLLVLALSFVEDDSPEWSGENLDQALAYAEAAIQLDDENAAGHVAKATALKEMGRFREAQSCARRAVELASRDSYVRFYDGLLLERSGEYRRALAEYERAIDLDPDWAFPYGRAGWVLAHQGRLDDAVRYFEESIRRAPPNQHAIGNLVLAYHQLGRIEDALATAEQGIARVPDMSWTHEALAMVLEEERRPGEAIEQYALALELTPRSASTLHRLELVLRSWDAPACLGTLDRVVRALEALDQDGLPQRMGPRFLAGLAIARLHADSCADPERALRDASSAAYRSDLREADVLASKAAIQWALGETCEAVLTLERAIRLPGSSSNELRQLERYREAMSRAPVSYASIDARLTEGGRTGDGEDLMRQAAVCSSSVTLEQRLLYLEGRLLQLSGATSEALTRFRELVLSEDERPEPHLRLLQCLDDLDLQEEAESHLLHVVETTALSKREFLERWVSLLFSQLDLSPGEVLSRLVAISPEECDREFTGYVADLRWLLDRLARRECVRIDCGAKEDAQAGENSWSRDRFFVGGCSQGPVTVEIEGAGEDIVYQTWRRYDSECIRSEYRLPLPPGDYLVVLHFAETRFVVKGKRRFDVLLEGDTRERDYEPLTAGFATAQQLAFDATVDDGLLEIEFDAEAGAAVVAGIEVTRLAGVGGS